MRNIQSRIEKLEKGLAPSEMSGYRYYRLDNGKYLIIPPSKEGLKTVIEYLYEGTYTESPLTLQQILEKYPNIVDDTEKINAMSKSLDDF